MTHLAATATTSIAAIDCRQIAMLYLKSFYSF